MKPGDAFHEGDKVPLSVIRVDPDGHRIVLSARRYLELADEEGVRDFHARFASRQPAPAPPEAPSAESAEQKAKRRKKLKDGSPADQAEAEAMAAAEALAAEARAAAIAEDEATEAS